MNLQITPDPKDCVMPKGHDPRQGVYATGKGMTAYFVDGTWVRNNVWQDFVEGGNSQRYPFVPEGEYWVEFVDANEADYILIHETVECNAMKEEGLSYEKAHSLANVAEFEARQHPEITVHLLRSLEWNV